MNRLWNWFTNPPWMRPCQAILIRFMAGGVFLWEGILKFVYVNQGVGRFTKIGIPFQNFRLTLWGALKSLAAFS